MTEDFEFDLDKLAEEFEQATFKSNEPPKTMKDLENRIILAGQKWRADRTKTIIKDGKEETKAPPRPNVSEVAENLNRLVDFALVGKGDNTDKLQLYIYDIDKGIYTSNDDLFNKFCRLFDNRVAPKDWGQVKTMVRTMATQKAPLTDPELIPVGNGIVNLKTKELLPFSPKYVITSKIATEYHAHSVVPKDREGNTFENWLNSIACGDSEIVTLLMQLMQEAINSNYTRGKFAILYGEGNNGKGTFQRLLLNLIGETNVSALKPTDFSEKHALEMLEGKVCNIGDDFPNTYLKNASNLMSITTGDTVMVNPKGRKGYEASYKLFNIFSGNYIPNSGNKSHGWYRRVMIVPFNADFNGEIEKPWIKNEFLADKKVLEYVLYKVINQPSFDKFIEPQAVKDLLEEYKEDNDYILAWVKDEYIAKNWHELDVVPIPFVTDKLKIYAKDMGIDNPKLYGAGKLVAKSLNALTDNHYKVKRTRMKKSDFPILNPSNFETDNKRLSGVNRSIVKDDC